MVKIPRWLRGVAGWGLGALGGGSPTHLRVLRGLAVKLRLLAGKKHRATRPGQPSPSTENMRAGQRQEIVLLPMSHEKAKASFGGQGKGSDSQAPDTLCIHRAHAALELPRPSKDSRHGGKHTKTHTHMHEDIGEAHHIDMQT